MTTATTILQVLEGTLAECQKHIAFYTLETSAFEVFQHFLYYCATATTSLLM
jgi:hypothetical protein